MGGSLEIGEVLLTKWFFGFPTFVETPKIKTFLWPPCKETQTNTHTQQIIQILL